MRRNEPTQINLIWKVVHKIYATNPSLDIEELFAEGCLAYSLAMEKYDPARGAFSTFIWTAIRNHLCHYAKKEYERYDVITYHGIMGESEDSETSSFDDSVITEPEEIDNEFLNSLFRSCEGVSKTLIKLILRGTGSKSHKNPIVLRSIRDAAKNHGYESVEINKGIEEIKEILKIV